MIVLLYKKIEPGALKVTSQKSEPDIWRVPWTTSEPDHQRVTTKVEWTICEESNEEGKWINSIEEYHYDGMNQGIKECHEDKVSHYVDRLLCDLSSINMK